MNYKIWPFQPFHQHFVEQADLWWEHCHLPCTAELLLLDSPHWVILDGGAGSGKSVSLAALTRRDNMAFVIPYPPSRWPGNAHALRQDADSHLTQMMANAAQSLRDHLIQEQSNTNNLDELQIEFVRWLLETHFGGRAYRLFIHQLPDSLAEQFKAVAYENLYPTATEPLDVQGQINELVGLVRTLGFQRVLFAVDIHTHDAQVDLASGLSKLFGWLELMHHPRFAVAAAVPTNLLKKCKIEARARHRVRHIALQWSTVQCRTIAEKHMQQALLDTEEATLSAYADEDVLAEMGTVIEMIYGRATPAGWVALAETLLHLIQRPNKPLPAPLQLDDITLIKQSFYGRHMPLRLDMESHGVWRGPQFLALDEKLLEFLTLLLRRRGKPINFWDDLELNSLAGNANNVHAIASRTRKAIEPLPKKKKKPDYVYLCNKRGGGGYWLENYTIP